MFSKNIVFRNFKLKKNINDQKKLKKILKKELFLSSDLFNSFTKKYNYSFTKKKIQKYRNYETINLIGMGGSILGTEAIYDFLRFKIKKKN